MKPFKGNELYMSEIMQPTDTIQNIFHEGKLKTENDEDVILLDTDVDPHEGYFLYAMIKENKFKNILEIGMGNGINSLYICSALEAEKNRSKSRKETKLHLISIDPFQKSEWENTGIQTLKDAGLLKYHTLIREPDFIALPELLKDIDKTGKFDLILVNGNDSFEYIVLDFYFSINLLKIGGVIVLDDIKNENIAKAYKYFQTNYLNLVEVKNTLNYMTQGTFIKVAEDARPWFFHINF
jgi:predicted O-methyltransferase YrrM